MWIVLKEMNIVRLQRIGQEYCTEHCRTINSIFPVQHEHKISACTLFYVPDMHSGKTAATDVSFCNVLSLNFS